ncbi:MAG: hypothetical protein NVSMB20_03190 [Bradyrhizobium sp.]
MALTLLGFTDLVGRFATQARATANTALDFTVGSLFRALAEANATLGLQHQANTLRVLQTTRLATSTGIDCDTFGNDYGFTRLPAAPASGKATFSRASVSTSQTIIPVGLTVTSTDNSQTFAVVADTTNLAYVAGTGYVMPAAQLSLGVSVQSTTNGAAGNIAAGALGFLTSAKAGLDFVSNAAPFTGGADAETDAAYRTRFQLFIDSRSRGTLAAIRFSVASVRSSLLLAIGENVDSGGNYRPGSFVVTVDDGSGSPPSSLLTQVYNAVDLIRPVGCSFVVLPPSVLTATISLTLTAASGYNKAALIGPVATAILNYVSGLAIGVPLPYTRIANLAYSVPGVQNVTALLVNGGTADIGGGVTQVVRATTATVVVA